MRIIFIILSFIGLALTIFPAFFVFSKVITWETYITLMITGTLLWFLTVPFWMKKGDEV
jgi:hypothetical protein